MFKVGFSGAVLGFIYVMSLTFFSPFCTLCFTPLLGVGVGYLAAKIDQVQKVETGASRGGGAGAISSVGVILGQIIATLVNGVLITNLENLPAFMQELGLPSTLAPNPDEYWQGTLLASSVCGTLNLMVIVGLAALGGMLWVQRQGQRSAGVV